MRPPGTRLPISSAVSAQPLYQQVKHYIQERIRTGIWPPDSRIPSENDLVHQLRVSRMTVNRALRELTAEGRLIRVQGVGTFVAPPKPQSALLEIRSIAEEIRAWGGKHDSRVHLLRTETADRELAAAMGLPEGAPVFHSVLLHRDRGRAIQLAERYVNPEVAPDYLQQDFNRITPSEYLLQVAPVTEAEHILEAVLPDADTAALLEIIPSHPCLVLHRRTWSGRIVATQSRFIHPGGRYRIGGRFRPVVAGD